MAVRRLRCSMEKLEELERLGFQQSQEEQKKIEQEKTSTGYSMQETITSLIVRKVYETNRIKRLTLRIQTFKSMNNYRSKANISISDYYAIYDKEYEKLLTEGVLQEVTQGKYVYVELATGIDDLRKKYNLNINVEDIDIPLNPNEQGFEEDLEENLNLDIETKGTAEEIYVEEEMSTEDDSKYGEDEEIEEEVSPIDLIDDEESEDNKEIERVEKEQEEIKKQQIEIENIENEQYKLCSELLTYYITIFDKSYSIEDKGIVLGVDVEDLENRYNRSLQIAPDTTTFKDLVRNSVQDINKIIGGILEYAGSMAEGILATTKDNLLNIMKSMSKIAQKIEKYDAFITSYSDAIQEYTQSIHMKVQEIEGKEKSDVTQDVPKDSNAPTETEEYQASHPIGCRPTLEEFLNTSESEEQGIEKLKIFMTELMFRVLKKLSINTTDIKRIDYKTDGSVWVDGTLVDYANNLEEDFLEKIPIELYADIMSNNILKWLNMVRVVNKIGVSIEEVYIGGKNEEKLVKLGYINSKDSWTKIFIHETYKDKYPKLKLVKVGDKEYRPIPIIVPKDIKEAVYNFSNDNKSNLDLGTILTYKLFLRKVKDIYGSYDNVTRLRINNNSNISLCANNTRNFLKFHMDITQIESTYYLYPAYKQNIMKDAWAGIINLEVIPKYFHNLKEIIIEDETFAEEVVKHSFGLKDKDRWQKLFKQKRFKELKRIKIGGMDITAKTSEYDDMLNNSTNKNYKAFDFFGKAKTMFGTVYPKEQDSPMSKVWRNDTVKTVLKGAGVTGGIYAMVGATTLLGGWGFLLSATIATGLVKSKIKKNREMGYTDFGLPPKVEQGNQRSILDLFSKKGKS